MMSGPPRLSQETSAPKYKPIFITIVSAAVLAAGSCYGFLSTEQSWTGIVFAGLFLICTPVALVAVIVLLIRSLGDLFQLWRG